jgi:S1-C subfamily serine protease
MKKLTLLKPKLKTLLQSTKRTTLNLVPAVLLVSIMGYMSVRAPEIHGLYLRYKVGNKVYMIQGRRNGGGGTGFAAKAPSGQSYIVTNSHVCEGALEQSEDKTALLVTNGNTSMRRKIIENSDFTDLCILEGLPGVEGLSISGEPDLGETLATVGHPLLRPLSVSKGEIVGSHDAEIMDYIMSGNKRIDELVHTSDKKCDLPKNKIVEENDIFFGQVKLCNTVTKDVYLSTIVIFPGNSGSPVVDFWGDVVGVAFAADKTSWAWIVSNKDLKRFLAHY